MRLNSPRRKMLTADFVRTVVISPIVALALLALMAPSVGAATSVSGGDAYRETFRSLCGSSGTVEVWHPGGYAVGRGSVTVTGTFPDIQNSVAFTALSTGSGCAQSEFRYFAVQGSSAGRPSPTNGAQCPIPNLDLYDCFDDLFFGLKFDKPVSAQTTTDGKKILGYYLTRDNGSAVYETNWDGARATEIIEDSNGNPRLGDSVCLGTIVHTTEQGIAQRLRDHAMIASSLSGTSGCLTAQEASSYIAAHQQRESAFASSWPLLYDASAWSYSTD